MCFYSTYHLKGSREEEGEEVEDTQATIPLDIRSNRTSLDNVPPEITSNRTSLIITHEDGTVEENEGEVTCLGLTPDVERKSKIFIEEVSQENQASPALEEASATRPDSEVRFKLTRSCPTNYKYLIYAHICTYIYI